MSHASNVLYQADWGKWVNVLAALAHVRPTSFHETGHVQQRLRRRVGRSFAALHSRPVDVQPIMRDLRLCTK